jgi:hypothetical protein
MNKIKLSIIALTAGAMALGGCDKDFLDINQNPNNPTEVNVTPNLATAAQLNNSAGRNAASYDFLNRWMGYWSASGSYSRSTVEMSYNLTNDFGSGIWNGIYYTVGQYRSIEKKASDLNQQFYRGIAIAMQAFEMQNLVDVYGDVPYSKAFDLVGNIRPAYDDDEAIYKDLMVRLDTALAAIKRADVDPNITTQDIIFKGNKTNWYKFINTIKLRLLVYTSGTSTFNRSAEIAKITAEGSGFLGNGVGAMAQPGYSSSKPNPYYASHLHTESGNEADNYNRANCFFLNMMTPMADIRYTRQYRTAKALGNYSKCTSYGQNPLDDVNSDRTPGPGYGLIRVPNSTFTTPPNAVAATGATMPMWVMTSVEAMFLVAEATARGWLAGDPKVAYENAVRESFTYLTLTTADADTYLAGTDPKVMWPAAPTEASMLNVIIWQKYFALNGLQANATWADWRRTGIVPVPLSIAPERGSNPIPVRLLYPSSEYSFNKDNVAGEGTISQFTSKVFWDN